MTTRTSVTGCTMRENWYVHPLRAFTMLVSCCRTGSMTGAGMSGSGVGVTTLYRGSGWGVRTRATGVATGAPDPA